MTLSLIVNVDHVSMLNKNSENNFWHIHISSSCFHHRILPWPDFTAYRDQCICINQSESMINVFVKIKVGWWSMYLQKLKWDDGQLITFYPLSLRLHSQQSWVSILLINGVKVIRVLRMNDIKSLVCLANWSEIKNDSAMSQGKNSDNVRVIYI